MKTKAMTTTKTKTIVAVALVVLSIGSLVAGLTFISKKTGEKLDDNPYKNSKTSSSKKSVADNSGGINANDNENNNSDEGSNEPVNLRGYECPGSSNTPCSTVDGRPTCTYPRTCRYNDGTRKYECLLSNESNQIFDNRESCESECKITKMCVKADSDSGSSGKFVGPFGGGSIMPTCTKKTIPSDQALPDGCGVWVNSQKYSKVYDENGNFRAYCPDSSGTVSAYVVMGSKGFGGCVSN